MLGVRPEHFRITEQSGSSIVAKVHVVEALGSESFVHADTSVGDRITVKADGDTPIQRGETVHVTFDPLRAHLFAADGTALARTG